MTNLSNFLLGGSQYSLQISPGVGFCELRKALTSLGPALVSSQFLLHLDSSGVLIKDAPSKQIVGGADMFFATMTFFEG